MRDFNVYYLAGSEVPAPTASSVHVLRMSNAMRQLTGRVTLFCKEGSDESVAEYYGISPELRIISTQFRSRLDLFRYMRALHSAPRPDFALGRYAYATALMAASQVPVIYEVHAPATGIKRRVEDWLLRQHSVLGLVAITQALADHYLARYPQVAGRCLVLPDAANDPGAATLPRSQGALRVAYVGSWYPGRGIELIVDLAKRLPEMEFTIAGGQRGDLVRLGFDPPSNLRCVGYVAPSRVDALLANADVLLAPYTREVRTGFRLGLDTTQWCSPMKLFEYMSHGKAILCSDLPVLREVLTDRDNCLLIDPERVEAWVEALREVHANRHLARKLGTRARSQFLERHTWLQRASRVLEFAELQLTK